MSSIDNISDVVAWRLCVGCGACAFYCPEKNIRLTDIVKEGIRPEIIDPAACGPCKECLQVCPGYSVDYTSHRKRIGIQKELVDAFGPILEIWEGHANDAEIRFQGSSGGALTALSLYCLEQENMAGVLHIGQDPDDVLRNKTRLSKSRSQLLSFVGSRYAPASACDRLDLIEGATAPCVFIGQPSEVAALRKVQNLKPQLMANVGVALSFFCAGSPATQGTLELLSKLSVATKTLTKLRYRGRGWPGMFSTISKNETAFHEHQTYQESWAFLQAYRPYSSHLQPDGAGDSADISCGDPWYRKVVPSELGSSLVIVRTERGRQIVHGAMGKGYLNLTPAEPWKLIASQKNLTDKRSAIWGRRIAFKMFGLPVTKIKGIPLFRLWLHLPFRDKFKSIAGTVRRLVRRKYYRQSSLRLPR
jgi:coenzyme F420 hydrogenase subunit beta